MDLGRGFPYLNEKKNPDMKKNPENSDAIECSGGAIRITNRFLVHPETLPDIDRPNQLLRSSEIGPIEDGGAGIIGDTQAPARPAGRPGSRWEGGLRSALKCWAAIFYRTYASISELRRSWLGLSISGSVSGWSSNRLAMRTAS